MVENAEVGNAGADSWVENADVGKPYEKLNRYYTSRDP